MRNNKLLWLVTALLALAILLVACGANSNGNSSKPSTTEKPKETTTVSRYESVDTYTDLPNHLSWEQINAFPVVNESMTIEEARELAVSFFRYAKTALWICDNDLEFIKNSSGSQDEMLEGVVYGGLPYVGLGSGNVYRLLDYMDPDTGVVNIKNAVDETEKYDGWKVFGNQCSIGAYWGFGRVINSANYRWTQGLVANNKFVMLGDLVVRDKEGNIIPIQDAKRNWSSNTESKPENYGTDECIKDNDPQKLFEAYALMHHGDGMVYYTTAGHVIMIATDPVVVRNADDTIDPDASFVTIIDQGQTWYEDGVAADGTQFTYKGGVDTKVTFTKLMKGNYVPFTFLEFTGEDPFESATAAFSLSGEEITTTQLFSSTVTSNYGISDVYAVVYDEDGNEVYKHAVRCTQANQKELKLTRTKSEKSKVPTVETWGVLGFTPGHDLTVKIVVQLSTGDRPTIYEGTLVQG